MKWLLPHQPFPSYSETSAEGIIALGGNLSIERLTEAYQKGIFPWYNAGEPIIWWFPKRRFVLFPSKLRVSKSMKKLYTQSVFRVTQNQCFEEVMAQCKAVRRKGQSGTWIHQEMQESYLQLHQKGMAKSIEVWNSHNKLVGGLYGIEIENIFCGESMFSLESNASKYGFIHFIKNSNYQLIDCQIYTQHLESLGAEEISSKAFLKYLPTNIF